MKLYKISYQVLFISSFIYLNSLQAQNSIGLISSAAGHYQGYTLFAPISSNTTYLIDNNGEKINAWESNFHPGNSAYLLENGSLLRTAKSNNSRFNLGGAGGRIEQFTWDGDLVWRFNYSSDLFCQHHDIEYLPNGNILLIAWEFKTAAEALEAGCKPALIEQAGIFPDHIIEINPSFPVGGVIVWEWHVWDHLIQDYDAAKNNFGIVSDHPELIDLNFTPVNGFPRGLKDWNHTNAIDYNAELDQIIVSIHVFSEIWIIDHSTTTLEAAGHSGGNSDKGGDLLYRWGNPATYGAGGAADQMQFRQHDAHWIAEDVPGAGNLLVFNNGRGRTGGNYTSIDEVTPPLTQGGYYILITGQSYAPSQLSWTYTAPDPIDFYADHISGAQRQPNGNTLICDGPHGTIFEVTDSGETVWKYINPVVAEGPLTQGDTIPDGEGSNSLFRAYRYGSDYEAFNGRELLPQGPIETYNTLFPETDIFTRIPSDSAGERGLIVRISPPMSGRFAGGAPIVIYMPGGFHADGLGERHTGLCDQGFIEIRFNFPGSGTYPYDSEGTYDHRGPSSLTAARDVIRFAMGLQTDVTGCTISELIAPISPLSGNVGLIGWSNGGNTNICAAGVYGADLPGLAWILNWESPVGDGMPQAEAGAKNEGSLRPFNTGVNPSYDPDDGTWDFTDLAWDEQVQIPILDHTNEYVSGGLYIDINHDQIIDRGSDFIFYPLIFDFKGRDLAFYSERVQKAAASAGLIPNPAPAHTVSVSENESFWHWRNGAYWVEDALQHNPDLMFMIVASDTDHVQISPDHPHVILQYNAFLNDGCRFVRLNPDRSYIEDFLGQPYPTAVDNDAFMTLDRLNMNKVVEPGNSIQNQFNKVTVAAAGACELADRTYYNDTSPQLNGMVTDVGQDLKITRESSIFQNSPNPFNNSTNISFSLERTEKIKIDVLNILGQQVETLVDRLENAGTHTISWNADRLPAGVYILRLSYSKRVRTCKCLLLK